MTQDPDIDASEFEWWTGGTSTEEADAAGSTSRGSQGESGWRSWVLSGLPGRAVLFALVMTPLLLTSAFLLTGGATAAVSFTAADVHATSHNGMLQSLTAAPNGTITYEGFEKQASTVHIEVQVQESDGSWTTITSKDVSVSGYSGSVEYSFTETSILQNSGWKKGDFTASDGQNSTTQMTIRVNATFDGTGPSGSDVTTSTQADFVVEVENIQSGSGIGGQANTGGSGNA